MTRARKTTLVALLLMVLLGLFLVLRGRTPGADRGPATASEEPGISYASGRWARTSGGASEPNKDPAELVLTLRGRVIDTSRSPVPDASVELLFRPAGNVAVGPAEEIRTD